MPTSTALISHRYGESDQLDHANLATGNGFRPAHERSELDRWMLAELHATGKKMVDAAATDHYVAAGALSAC